MSAETPIGYRRLSGGVSVARAESFRAVLEKANEERRSIPETACRCVLNGVPVTDSTVRTYIHILGIKWHHRRAYRPTVDKTGWAKVAKAMLYKGYGTKEIAERLGSTYITVRRFLLDEGLIERSQSRRHV